MRLFARRLKRSCLFDDSGDRLGQEIVHWGSPITPAWNAKWRDSLQLHRNMRTSARPLAGRGGRRSAKTHADAWRFRRLCQVVHGGIRMLTHGGSEAPAA